MNHLECIYTGVINLFKTEPVQNPQCAAIALAVAAFVLGILFTCILCKICRPCASRKNCKCGHKGEKFAREPKFEKLRPAPADGSIEIYVGNLSYDLTEDLLRKEFEKFGKVNSARIITNRSTGKSKGFGFVHMPNRAEADAAVAALSEKEILGRKLRCNQAKNVAE